LSEWPSRDAQICNANVIAFKAWRQQAPGFITQAAGLWWFPAGAATIQSFHRPRSRGRGEWRCSKPVPLTTGSHGHRGVSSRAAG